MKRIFVIGLVLALFGLVAMAGQATAKVEEVQLGPYEISFNLNIIEPYTVEIEPNPCVAIEDYSGTIVTKCGASINVSNEIVFVGLNYFETGEHMNASRAAEKERATPIADEFKAEMYRRPIDGYDGYLVVKSSILRPNLAYHYAYYTPDPATLVIIYSSLPWWGGTLNLLKTIHVEKVGSHESDAA